MSIKTQNKQNRKGMNLYAIIGGIALAAILGLVVAPRLASAELPGFRSNLQSDMNSIQEMLESYGANHQGSFQGLFDGHAIAGGNSNTFGFDVLMDERVMDGAMAANVNSVGGRDVYNPSWSIGGNAAGTGDVSLEIGPVLGDNSKVNVLVIINADTGIAATNNVDMDGFTAQLATTVTTFARDKYGNYDGTASATIGTGDLGDPDGDIRTKNATTIEAPTAIAAPAQATILYTVQ